jgi:hypothetical protein
MWARAGWLLLGVAFASTVNAAAPGLESLYPAGGRAGSEIDMRVAGSGLDKGSPMGWANHPGLVLRAGDKPKAFRVVVGSEVPAGPYLVRFHTDEGATPPRIFEVGTVEDFSEKEPNDVLADARVSEAKMNFTVNGILEKSGDVDTYAVRAQKGKRMRVELHGYGLGSPMDPAMRLLDERGVEMAAGHDTHNLDPRLENVPAGDGTMYVQVFAFAHPPAADVTLKGSASHVYRLTVTDAFKAEGPVSEPEVLTLPTAIRGRLSKAAEEDRYGFKSQKGAEWQIDVRAQALRSPVDAVLRVEDAEGNVLQQADDGEKEGLDPAMRWKAPKEDEFRLVVADRFQHGGEDHVYELSVKPFVPAISGTLDTHAYRVEAGKTVEVKLTVKTSGTFKGVIRARAAQLPGGVTSEVVEVPGKGGEVKVVLKAAAEAVGSQAPFAVEIVTGEPDAVQAVAATYALPFSEPRGDLLIMTDSQPWLTVVGRKSDGKSPTDQATAAKTAGTP